MTGVTDSVYGSYAFNYDGAYRLTDYTDPFGHGAVYVLNGEGQATSATDSLGNATGYAYGVDGRLLSVTDPGGGLTEYRYDEGGRPFEVIRGNGLKSITIYDALGRLQQIADPGLPGSSVLFYEYDPDGNITAIRDASGAEAYSYDIMGRLLQWRDRNGVATDYNYDAAGNLIQKGSQTFTHDAANQITNPGFSYDADGNLTSDGRFTYGYDEEDRLVRVTNVSDGSLVAEYGYDYRGLRMLKRTPAGTTRYHWDAAGRLIRESDEAGNTLALYVWNTANQLVALQKDGQWYYPHTNARGDILSMTDATGSVVASYEYGPWGELISSTGNLDQPWRYAGYYYDGETGLYYLKARYYSSDFSTFLTQDTLQGVTWLPWSLNTYAYVGDNPTNYVDPTGHFAFAIPLIVPTLEALWTVAIITVSTMAAIWTGDEIGRHLAEASNSKGKDYAEGKYGELAGSAGSPEPPRYRDRKPGKKGRSSPWENKQFRDAVREINKELGRGRLLTKDEEEILHRAIDSQGYDFWTIVEVGLSLFSR